MRLTFSKFLPYARARFSVSVNKMKSMKFDYTRRRGGGNEVTSPFYRGFLTVFTVQGGNGVTKQTYHCLSTFRCLTLFFFLGGVGRY